MSASYQYNGLGDRVSETNNGVTTSFTLDLNAGLTQALSDGANTYLYGNGRIGQFTGEESAYFLGDALGSVRQLVDGSGAVTLTQSYEPYGEVIGSSGTGQSTYGYTGEWTAGDLVYLRARYYHSIMSRFLSRDTWAGDYHQPMSYNAWLYGYSNPVRFRDPTGHIPTLSDIREGNQVYSCNCGFVDLSHANPSVAMSVYELLDQYKDQFKGDANSYRQDVFAISPSATAALIGKQSVTAVVNVNRLNGEFDRIAIAHGIYRSLGEEIENAQGKTGLWFTHYSFEDLTSDEIGFYIATKYKKRVDARKDDEVWNDLAELCDFPKDREEARRVSEQVWNKIGGNWFFIKTPQVREWGAPLLFCVEGICKKGNGKWPSQFSSIPSVGSTFSRDKEWWIYNEQLDGTLINSSYSGFYFLEKRK